MVLVKMLMKITLPKMGELLVMTAVTISPSRREVSPAEQLCQSPRLVSASVPPRDSGVWSRKPPYDFFQVKTPHIGEYGHRGPSGWPTRQGGAQGRGGGAAHPRGQVVAPLVILFRQIFFIFSEMVSCEVSGLFELCRIGFQSLLLFQPRIPAAGILPLHVNLVK